MAATLPSLSHFRVIPTLSRLSSTNCTNHVNISLLTQIHRLYSTPTSNSSSGPTEPTTPLSTPFSSSLTTDKKSAAASEESRWRRLKRLRREWYKGGPPTNRPQPKYDRTKVHGIGEAIQLIRDHSFAKFDESVELIFRLNIDPRHASHNLRGTLTIPHGTGRDDKVAVFAKDDEDIQAALKAGAKHAGGDDMVERVISTKGKVLKGCVASLATVDIVADLASKAGRILGPKGLLPSAKGGTVIPASEKDIGQVVKRFLEGKVYYRVDKFATLHMNVGKLSFTDEMLRENVTFVIKQVFDMKPKDVKRKYFKKTFMCSSMSPSVMISAEDEMKNILMEDRKKEEEEMALL